MATNQTAASARNVRIMPRRVRLHDLPPTRHSALFRDIDNLLAEHGIAGTVTALQVDDRPPNSHDCPDGQSRQVICRREPDGTIECSEECV